MHFLLVLISIFELTAQSKTLMQLMGHIKTTFLPHTLSCIKCFASTFEGDMRYE